MELRPDSDVSGMPTSLHSSTAVGVLSPSFHDDADAICRDLLTVDDPADLRVLIVDVTASPLRVRRRLVDHLDQEPDSLAVIGVEYMEPSEQTSTSTDTPSAPEAETTYVQEPGDLAGIGVAASATLREWADADEQVVVCLRSLTTILQYADDGPTLSFLRELLDHCERADALVHVHLDPTAVDEQTVEGVRGQVDAVVELTPE